MSTYGYNTDAFSFMSEADLMPVWTSNSESLLFPEETNYDFWEQGFSATYLGHSFVEDPFEELKPQIYEQPCQVDPAPEVEPVNHNFYETFAPPSEEYFTPSEDQTRSFVWEQPMMTPHFIQPPAPLNCSEEITIFPQPQVSHSQNSNFFKEEKPYVCPPTVSPPLPEIEVRNFCDSEGEPSADFKLPASKSPIMEAMVVCAIKKWGIEIVKNTKGSAGQPSEVIFRVTDFDRYYRISRAICSKQHPTEDVVSRVKSLRRWFQNFPKKKDIQENPQFLLVVKSSGAKKVSEIIERNTRLLSITKRRRQ